MYLRSSITFSLQSEKMCALFHYIISGFTKNRGRDYMMMDVTGSGDLDFDLVFFISLASSALESPFRCLGVAPYSSFFLYLCKKGDSLT